MALFWWFSAGPNGLFERAPFSVRWCHKDKDNDYNVGLPQLFPSLFFLLSASDGSWPSREHQQRSFPSRQRDNSDWLYSSQPQFQTAVKWLFHLTFLSNRKRVNQSFACCLRPFRAHLLLWFLDRLLTPIITNNIVRVHDAVWMMQSFKLIFINWIQSKCVLVLNCYIYIYFWFTYWVVDIKQYGTSWNQFVNCGRDQWLGIIKLLWVDTYRSPNKM